MTPRAHGRQGIIDENLEYEAVTGMHIHFERHAVTYFEKKNVITTAKRTGAPTGPRACLKPVHARPAGLAKISSPARPWPGRACQEKRPEEPVEARRPGRASAFFRPSLEIPCFIINY